MGKQTEGFELHSSLREEFREYYEATDPARRWQILEELDRNSSKWSNSSTGSAEEAALEQEIFRLRHPHKRKPEAEDVYLQVFFDLIRISKDGRGRSAPRNGLSQLKTMEDRLGFRSIPASGKLRCTDGPTASAGLVLRNAGSSTAGAKGTDVLSLLGEADQKIRASQEQALQPTSTLTAREAAIYRELRNALRRFLEATDTESYGRRFMGMIRLKKDEQLQHACIEVWHILNGLELLSTGVRLEELRRPARIVTQAITDEYAAHDEDAEARLHHVALAMKAGR